MSRSSQIAGARINLIVIIVAAVAALALVVLVALNPPKVVDGPVTPEIPVETPTETPTETPVETPTETPDETPVETPETTPPTTPTSNSCTPDSDSGIEFTLTPSDDTWIASMDSEARPILEQIVSAYGGLEKLSTFESLYGKANSHISAGGQEANSEVELWIRMPNQVRTLARLPLPIPGQYVETLIVWAGENGWSKALNQQNFQMEVQELGPEFALQALEEIEIHPVFMLLNLKEEAARFTYLGIETIECGEAHALQFQTARGSTGTYYFDPASFKTIKLHREGGGIIIEKYYDNFATTNGFSLPTEIRTVVTTPQNGDFITNATYEEFQVNIALDDELFEEPTLD